MSAGPATRHLGLDLGATNLKWAVVERSGDAWRMLAHGQVPSRIVPDPDEVPDAIVAQLGEVALAAIGDWGPVASIGIGVPGLYDPATGRTRFLPNVPGPWAGHLVAEPIAAAAGVPAFLVNDARAFGLAELRLGAGRGASSMIGLTLGTGVGGVIAIGGRVYQGHDGTGGELGHQTIDPDGPWCGCGNRGCVEAYARADQIAAACGTETPEEAVRRRPGRRPAGAGRPRRGRPLPGDRDQQRRRRRHPRPGRHRRRRRGGRRAPLRPDPRGAREAGHDHLGRRRGDRGGRAGDAGRGDRGRGPRRRASGGAAAVTAPRDAAPRAAGTDEARP